MYIVDRSYNYKCLINYARKEALNKLKAVKIS